MKKRKSPVALVSFLVVLIVAVAIANMMSLSRAETHDHEEAPPVAQNEPAAAGKSRAAPKKEDLAKAAKNIMAKSGDETAPELRTHGGNDTPLAVQPKVVEPKPTPNPTQPSGQWYSNESGRK